MRKTLPLILAENKNPGNVLFAHAPITIQAAQDEGGLPTFTMNAYNGGVMEPGGWWEPVVVDLAGVKALNGQPKLPILRQHDMEKIVGHSTRVEITATAINVEGVLSGAGEDAEEVRALSKNGFPWQASIGAAPLRTEYLEANAKTIVNGREVVGPVTIIRECTLFEISFVPVGADTTTSASVAANFSKESSMNFEAWLKANGFDKATLSASQLASLEAAFKANAPEAEVKALKAAYQPEKAPAPAPVIAAGDDAEVKRVRTLRAAESARIDQIEKICAAHPEIKAKAIEEGWTTDRASLEILRAERGPANPPRQQATRENSSVLGHTLTAALCLSAGIAAASVERMIPEGQRQQVMNEALSANYRGASIQLAMQNVIHAAGGTPIGSPKSHAFIEAALNADRVLRAQGFTSVSLSGILGNVANKVLLEAYTAVEVTWPQIAAVGSNGDFKTHNRYRLDSTGAFKKVGPDGELKHAGLSEFSAGTKLDTYGTMVALTRQMIINDDLGAFLQLPALLGRMAALRIEELTYATLLGGIGTFFVAGNRNYMSGGTTALGIASLSAGVKLFRDAVDSNGKPVLVSPARLLVGTGLETLAGQLFNDQSVVVDGVTNTKSTTPGGNPHKGLFKPVVSPYVNNTAIKDQDGAAITGQTATGWGLIANPATRAAVRVAFLNGQQNPTIESADSDFATLGMQWRAFADFDVGLEDPNAAIWSAGA